ncbi:hypothetical protein [Rhodoferax sp.]|uniref:hypothetical protein n=1 Tax=Rhodoferax sp. TaxID=50421 RepID=UPI002774D201|nr:hypothetical protein [Rhodoferax sp.]
MLTFEVFNPLADWNEGDRHLSPHIQLRATVESEASATTVDVGPLLATDREVDECINRVIQQLEQLRGTAKRGLVAAKARQLSR